jgi:DNA end-binding protein Ku
VLLREVLKKTGKVGIGRVVIRTKEYLGMVEPYEDALQLILLRFPAEVVDIAEYNVPEGSATKWHISPKEMEMATTLLESMATRFNPEDYKDEFRERLSDAIKKRLKAKGATTTVEEEEAPAHDATTNVVDFMSLLKKSLEKKGEAPAKAPARKAAKKPATKKATKSSSKGKKSA